VKSGRDLAAVRVFYGGDGFGGLAFDGVEERLRA
jgi:hypothetical protein